MEKLHTDVRMSHACCSTRLVSKVLPAYHLVGVVWFNGSIFHCSSVVSVRS